jgi:hypothetical protein
MKKEHKNPKGGLTEAGRKYFERKEAARNFANRHKKD